MKMQLSVLLIALLTAQCTKEEYKPSCDRFITGKVVRTSCTGVVVIQLLDNKSIGEDGWFDVMSRNTYNDVIAIPSSCNDNPDLEEGDCLTFILTEYSPISGCAHCAMEDYPPKKKFNICVVK